MSEQQPTDIRELSGLVATVVLTGSIEPDFAYNLMEMRSYNEANDFKKIEYQQFDAKLVEAGRDAAVAHAIKTDYHWILQIDADAAPFPPNALLVLLQDAFVDFPQADVVGAYCQLKSPIPLPTIDTGTGTWEEHYPDTGVLPVIRTGAHFLLAKRSAFAKMGAAPWFRTRTSQRALDAMFEVDSFARCNLDGENPLTANPEWDTLLHSAVATSRGGPSHVGEDSGFCDRLRAVGGTILVDTRVVAGHIGKQNITPDMLRDAMESRDRNIRMACGILE